MLAGPCEKKAFSGTESHSDSIGFCSCRRSVRAAPCKPAVRVTMDSPESGKGGNGDRSFSSDTLSQVSRVSQVSQDSLDYNPELSSSVVDQTLSDSVFARSEDDDFDSLEPEQAGVKDGSHGDPPPRPFQGDGGEESDGRQRPWLLNDRFVVPRAESGLKNCADYAGSSATGRQHLGPVRGAWSSINNNNSDRLLQSPFGSNNNNSDRLLQSPFGSINSNSDRLLQSPFGQQNSSALQSLSLECVSACGRNCGSGSPAQPTLCPADGSRSHCVGSALTQRVCGPRGWGTSDWSEPVLRRPRLEDEYLADDELDSSGYTGRGGSAPCGPGFHGPCETGDGQERGLHEGGGESFVLSDRGVGVTLSSAVVSGPAGGGDHGPSAAGSSHSAAHTRGARVPQTFSSGERLQEPRLHRSVNDHRFHHHHLAGDRPWQGAKSLDSSHSSQRAAQPPHQGDPTGHDGCGATPHPGRSKLAPARWDARGLFSSRPLVPGFESPSSVSGRSSVDTAEEVAAELPPLAAGSGVVVEGSGVVVEGSGHVELGAGFACGDPPTSSVGVADSEGLSSGSARRMCRGRRWQAGDGDAVHANGDRPGSAGDRPGSAGDRPGSAGDRPGSAGDRPGSAGDRPGSAGDRPGSAGDRPGSAGDRPGSAGDRPGSAGDRPGSAGDRPGSAGDRPGSAGDRPGSAGDRPGSAGDRPGSAGDRPGSAGDRPGSAGDRPGCAGGVCRDHRWDAVDVDVDAVHTVGIPGRVDAVHTVGIPGHVDAVHTVGIPGHVDAGAVHAVDMPGFVGAVGGGRVPDAVDVDAGRAVDAGGSGGVPGEAVGTEDSDTGTTSECGGLCSPGAYDPQLVSASP